jgi:DNA-binding MurR/RpiR family transcriptional regulator
MPDRSREVGEDVTTLASETEPTCRENIVRVIPTLRGPRAAVGQYILDNAWAIRGMSVAQLADHAGVSESAVVRFALAAGYSGYRELSQALAFDLGRSLGLYHSHPGDLVFTGDAVEQGDVSIIRGVVALEVECMQDTLASLSEPLLHRVITSVSRARSVLLIGTGTAAPLAQMFSYRLASLGIAVSWESDPMMMVAQASRLGEPDVVFGISYSGRSRDTVQTLGYCQSRGVETIGLTATTNSPMATVCNVLLTVFSHTVSTRAAQFSARVAGLALLEGIATAVAESRSDDSMARLESIGVNQSQMNDLPDDWRA